MSQPIDLPPMRTHCLGRYLIDLPEEFALTAGSDVTLYYGLGKDFERVEVTVPGRNRDSQTLKEIVRKATRKLESEHHLKSPSKNMLAEVKKLGDSTVLVSAYNGHRMLESFELNLYAQIEDAVARYKDFKYKRSELTLDHIENQLLNVARKTRFFGDPERASSGACLASVAIDAGQDGEVISAYFLSGKNPDVKITLSMDSLPAKGDGGLLQRVNENAGILGGLGLVWDTLRRGDREIANRAGEELLIAGKERGKVVRRFRAETLVTEPSNPQRPVIAITMGMGGQNADAEYIDSSLSEGEALAWWDAVVGSIRPRAQ